MTAAAFRQHAQCTWCSESFVVVSIGQRFCSDSCRYRAKHAKCATSPEYRLSVRARCREWAAEKRGVKKRNPWLLGAPISEPFLPGGAVEIYSDTPLRYPLEHRNIRGLHGAITALTSEDHDPKMPMFALIPWHRGIGWGVYLRTPEALGMVAGTRRSMRLYDQVLDVRFGGAVRIKAPMVTKRGRRRLRIDAITPVCTRVTQSPATYQKASGANLLSTMCAWLPRRVDLEIGDDDARLEIVENSSYAAQVQLGGKFGTISGWQGSIVVECNAVSEWLLRVAETIGLGGRTAFGFGRIKVSEEQGAKTCQKRGKVEAAARAVEAEVTAEDANQ